MRTLLMAACLLSFFACSKDDKQTCTLDKINNKSYSGIIRLCDNQPGQFVEFGGKATLTVLDSIINIHLISTDSLFPFNQLIIATSDCQSLQDDTNWNFTDVHTHKDVGSAYGQGKYILLDLHTSACPTDQSFIGSIQ